MVLTVRLWDHLHGTISHKYNMLFADDIVLAENQEVEMRAFMGVYDIF